MPTREPTAALSGDLGFSGAGPAATAEFALNEAGFSVRLLQSERYGPIPKGEDLLAVLRYSDVVVLDFPAVSELAEFHHRMSIQVGRAARNTLVLTPGRHPHKTDTPFTAILYRGNRDLGKQLRAFFGISEPVYKDHFARQFAFHAAPEVFGVSDVFVARALLAALKDVRFSGRAEAYTSVCLMFDEPKYFFALGVREKGAKRQPKPAWWKRLQSEIGRAIAAQDAGVVLSEKFCRSTDVSHFRDEFRHDGVVELEDGLPVRVLHPRRATFWFELAALSSIHGELPAMPGQSIPRPVSDLR